VAGLFRDQVLQERRAQFLGSIRIGRNPSFTLVTVVALLLAGALVAYATLGEITRKTRLAGLLIPVQGTLHVSSPQAGTLVEVRVKEGDVVAADDVLLVVGGDRATAQENAAANDARHETVVAAPQDGVVAALTAQRGQGVQPGQTLAVLVPRTSDGRPGPLAAHLYAPSRTIAYLQEGQEVWLRYAAYPYRKFGLARGAIEAVGRTPLSAQELPAGPGQALMETARSSEPMYRVTVALASQTIDSRGQKQALKAGMTLEADVVQERRRIWEWLLEPVLAASGAAESMAGKAR